MVAEIKTYGFLIEEVIANYVYVDLEVELEHKSIAQIGIESGEISDNLTSKNFSHCERHLVTLKEKGLGLAGHNFRRFDAQYLFKEYPNLNSWLIIDTLELSVIIQPLQISHKLHKDYKLSGYAGNNPLEDAKATKLLLENLIRDFYTKPLPLQQTYSWLLTCGTEDADLAYQQLFDLLDVLLKSSPDIANLPQEAIASLDREKLAQFWQSASNQSFDRRLCVAALIAWNYESNLVNQAPSFSRWLSNLEDFPTILAELMPLMPNGFTYHPYLEYFGLTEFRSRQEEAVQAIVAGKRCLIVMATGGGKSLCYQLPALMMYQRQRALTVVISPLQALMADQVADLEAKGLHFATFINGTLTASERKQRLEALYLGTKGLLYISPEQLRSISIRMLFDQRPPAFWVVDEAHCISQWGHSFRPDYCYIPKFIRELLTTHQLSVPKLALLTATATVKVREDIKNLFEQFQLDLNYEIICSSVRDNLNYQVISACGNKERKLLEIVKNEHSLDNCTLIYTTTRKEAEKLAKLLDDLGIKARHYHGQITPEAKREILKDFKEGKLNVVTATCAFGMGINRPDVRHVIHHTLSRNLENYVQEAGRAGRDGLPAKCTLLFSENDADLVFLLQSLNHLTETDLKYIFLATRQIRDLIYQKAKEADWFWATVEEIFQRSLLDPELNPEQKDLKIKVALHYLETFAVLERAENLTTFINFHLKHRTPEESITQFTKYSETYDIAKYQRVEFEKLICAMHTLDNYFRQGKVSQQLPLELLSDEAGINIQEVKRKIQELKQARVCTLELPIALLISKLKRVTEQSVNDSRNNLERLCEWENNLLTELLVIQDHPSAAIQVNLRALAVRLDPDALKKLRAYDLINILNGWVSQGWLKLQQLSRDVVRLDKIEVEKHITRRQKIATSIVEVFYEDLGEQNGQFLPLKYELEYLLTQVNQQQSQFSHISTKELEKVLIWLHEQKIIRLTEGLNLLQQALKIRVLPDVKIDTKLKQNYPKIRGYYQDEARRTHLMIEYGKLENQTAREKLVQDYFQLSGDTFAQLYPDYQSETFKRPVTQADYHKIMGPLNDTQREIVLAEDPAIAVIAGPGSGKTRTIVHRIAYLVKVKRVIPERILILAYNRNAVRELQTRLLNLIGPQAFGLRIFTFHGLSLGLLGRTLGEEKQSRQEIKFDEILTKACQLFEQGDYIDNEQAQLNRLNLLGNLEYIFVDEYQDVAKNEYKLIQLISGKGAVDDPSRGVQINLCVIGDDDQNIYQFKGTNVRYIIQFEREYQAKQFLLVENYRSTNAIIQAANHLIRHNTQRCKRLPEQQVRATQAKSIDNEKPLESFHFVQSLDLAIWVSVKVDSWINSGVAANKIAILAREWDDLGIVRLFLEQQGIKTYALKKDGIQLTRNYITDRLINQLNKNPNLIIDSHESVEQRFLEYFNRCSYNLEQPTVKKLLVIANDIDTERGYQEKQETAIPITAKEIITAIYEFSNSGETYLDENAVLVTSCHGAKGLEFPKVILLGDNFNCNEAERRLFYVAMTRAKEELIFCCTELNVFISETGIETRFYQPIQQKRSLPKKLLYLDLTPSDVNLGFQYTKTQQKIIKSLQEGDCLKIKANPWRNGWNILTKDNVCIGALSRKGSQLLQNKGISPGDYEFSSEEVTVQHIYKHLDINQVTGTIQEFWYVVIPQIRLYRI